MAVAGVCGPGKSGKTALQGGEGVADWALFTKAAVPMGNLKKKRRLKISKHKRRKRSKANRHKKRTW